MRPATGLLPRDLLVPSADRDGVLSFQPPGLLCRICVRDRNDPHSAVRPQNLGMCTSAAPTRLPVSMRSIPVCQGASGVTQPQRGCCATAIMLRECFKL